MAITGYVSPKVSINQLFTQVASGGPPLLAACPVGPSYNLYRYNVPSEQASTAVVNTVTPSLGNEYQSGSNTLYPYPNQAVNTTIDLNYVAVNFGAVQGEYLPNTSLGSTGSNAAANLVAATSGYFPTRIRYSNGSGTILQTANGSTRSAYLSNRDVQVGDKVYVDDNNGHTLLSTVTGLLADTSAQNGALGSVVAPKLTPSTNPTDGVTNGTSTFTSASGSFTQAFVGNFLTIVTVGTYQVLAVNSATSLTISGTPTAATGLTYYVGGTYNATSNVAPQSATSSSSPVYVWVGSGSDPGTTDIDVAKASGFAYVGYNSQRILNDTYTATVTTGGLIAAAIFTITSANGAFSPVTGVMANGSDVLTLDANGSNLVKFDFTGTTASLTAGQTWHVVVGALVTLVEPVGAGTYTGAVNLTYKLTVTRGGPWYTGSNASVAAQVSITSTNIDSSSPVLVQTGVAFGIGTLGVTATFSTASNNGGLILGDVYYVPVTSAILGAVKTVEFADNLPAYILANNPNLTVSLYVSQPSISIPEISNVVTGTQNWVTTESGITINSGITTDDSNLVSNGIPVALPIANALVYVTHRDLNPTNANAIGSISDPSQIPSILGTIDPDNNLAQGVYDALLNSNGAAVYFIGVVSDDVDGYAAALSVASNVNYIYSLVPLTYDSGIQQLFVAHVDAMSTPASAKWRTTWISQPAQPTALLYNNMSNGQPWLATVSADPLASGTVYSLVTVSGATFLTDGVSTGDTVFLNFSSLPNGQVTYSQYVVAQVRSQTSLALAVGLPGAINVPEKFQLQKTYTSTQQATNLAAIAAGYANRRVVFVFPDTLQNDGVTLEGYYLAAASAGLRSGVPANQGLTNSVVLGFDTVTEASQTFSSTDLDLLASNGVWIVTQTVAGSPVFVRDQLTTDTSSLNAQEESVTSNVDSVSYQLQAAMAPYIGKYNINRTSIQLITNAINNLLSTLQSTVTSQSAGTQLLQGTDILSVTQDLTFKDRLNVSIQLVVPYPLDVLTITLLV